MRVAGLFCSMLLVACGGDDSPLPDAGDPPGTPREVVTESKDLLVGEIVEGILTGGPDDHAVISLTAPAPILDWNIHGHVNGDTQNLDEGYDAMTVHTTLTPPESGEWFLLLRNRGTTPITIEVEIGLYGDMQWSGWQL